MFSSLFKTFSSFFSSAKNKLASLFSRGVVDEQVIGDLRNLLISADAGPVVTEKIIVQLKERAEKEKAFTSNELIRILRSILQQILHPSEVSPKDLSGIVMLVGVNGSGKTTTAAKLATLAIAQGKRVVFVAADTFRAAAPEQLTQWANELGIPVIMGNQDQDPASVVFSGCIAWRSGKYDTMIIDTAGRVQTKSHLMDELAKVKRVVSKQLPRVQVTTLLTIDSMLGQNSLDQARMFNQVTQVDGIILTKCDGSGKGGIVFAISNELLLPIMYVTSGESATAIAPFNPSAFVENIL